MSTKQIHHNICKSSLRYTKEKSINKSNGDHITPNNMDIHPAHLSLTYKSVTAF
jgi:hypothetical protein